MFRTMMIAGITGSILTGCTVGSNYNAYSSPERIIITSDLMVQAGSHTEKSCLMLHEVGHTVLGHNKGLSRTSTAIELEADNFAYNVISEYGYDPCECVAFFKKVVENAPNFSYEHKKYLQYRVDNGIKVNSCKLPL